MPWARCMPGRDGGEGGRGRESSRPRSSGQPSTGLLGQPTTGMGTVGSAVCSHNQPWRLNMGGRAARDEGMDKPVPLVMEGERKNKNEPLFFV